MFSQVRGEGGAFTRVTVSTPEAVSLLKVT